MNDPFQDLHIQDTGGGGGRVQEDYGKQEKRGQEAVCLKVVGTGRNRKYLCNTAHYFASRKTANTVRLY